MANCDTCKSNATPESVPYLAHELALARDERTIKRLWVIILVLIALLMTTNGAWLWYESQFEDIYQEVTQDAESGTNTFQVIGGNFIGETDDKNP